MGCPNCHTTETTGYVKTAREPSKDLPDVEFIDIAFKCEACGYSWNCVGAKQL